jgi:hypothetical protein
MKNKRNSTVGDIVIIKILSPDKIIQKWIVYRLPNLSDTNAIVSEDTLCPFNNKFQEKKIYFYLHKKNESVSI